MYEQREIVLIPFPYSDLTGIKQRPALIISNNHLNATEDRICCLITSNKPKEGVLIHQKCLENGKLPFRSWVKPHRIFTVDKNIIRKKICRITKEFHTEVLSELQKIIKNE